MNIETEKWKKAKVAQSCPTIYDPMEYTDHGIVQDRILEWVADPFSSRSFWPKNQTDVSCISGDSLPTEIWEKFIETEVLS